MSKNEKQQWKGGILVNDRGYFALSYFIFTNQN